MKTMLNVALPKGRLGEKVYAMFEKAGFECPAIHEPGRKLIFENRIFDMWPNLQKLRPFVFVVHKRDAC